MNEYQNNLRREMLDEEYRYAYAEDFLNTFIATQIRVLREQRELTQQELGNLIGTKQEGISRLENVNYSAWKTETLRKLARALRVRLRITFEDFNSLIDDAKQFSKDDMKRVAFEEDGRFRELESIPTTNNLEALFAEIREGNKNEIVSQLGFPLDAKPKAKVIQFPAPQNNNQAPSLETTVEGGPIYAAVGGYSRKSIAVH